MVDNFKKKERSLTKKSKVETSLKEKICKRQKTHKRSLRVNPLISRLAFTITTMFLMAIEACEETLSMKSAFRSY
jgi:hypothetical protein